MKFLFASDSFKGTISSARTAELLGEAAGKVFPECRWESVEVADGGEGTTDAVIAALKGERVWREVRGPLGNPVSAYFGRIGENKAVLEMAAASGLPLLKEEERNPIQASTYGTGELILAALEDGCQEIVVAIGGSATNDGGMGCLRALGVRFLDQLGNELEGCGADLERVSAIDRSGLHPLIFQAKFTVMCDVTNPLTGPDGATRTFGKQKGGTPDMLNRLEAGMENYRRVLERTFGVDVNQIPGTGAAGGLGAALFLFLRAELKSGIETVLDLIHFDERLEGVSVVVTGEGRTDWQSAFGKVISGVGLRCQKKGIPVLVLSGGLGAGADKLYGYGVTSMMTAVDGPMPLNEALERAEELYRDAALRMFRILQVGRQLT
ncbi:glycerate kinase [Cuneatibacter sp. NSJ-177]|uniref:glycerate kinase family protein n=1 Tax=Cuneatibacter sp. NSJ-177 TaxID=2931401 RepID=UPI001FD4BED6|nr:glycerate kinase [Cuneatibacter sp. NSJ-177]MCJ7834012.1 glycerate kinase [Cuneatibacter sp. NSJ-177]